jgi:hypothetical protein
VEFTFGGSTRVGQGQWINEKPQKGKMQKTKTPRHPMRG